MINHPRTAKRVISLYNTIPLKNIIKGKKNNELVIDGLCTKCKISILGTGNTIKIGFLSQLVNTKIYIYGNNNSVLIDESCCINNGDIFIEDSSGVIHIGKDTSICGQTHLACIEGCRIDIGKDCLFSSGINIRTGDSHSILNNQTGERINPSKNVRIGNHVWIGNQVTILKGVSIAPNSVVATGSIVTKNSEKTNVILAGNPAKIVKNDIDWDGERI